MSKGTYATIMTKFDRLLDSDRYYNWYHGFTEIDMPKFDFSDASADAHETYHFNSHASSGTILTQFFGEKFSINELVKNVQFDINIYGPNDSIIRLEVEKVSIKRISSNDGFDNLRINEELIDPDLKYVMTNITEGRAKIILERNVSVEDIGFMELKLMPGFRLKWIFTENGRSGKSQAEYKDSFLTKEFVR